MIQYEIAQGRRCGNTIRMLFRALELASAGPNRKIFLLFGSVPALREGLNMARAICAPMQTFAILSYVRQQLRFGNGSIVQFWDPHRFETISGLGEIYDYAVDTSLERLDPEVMAFLTQSIRQH